MDGAGADGGEEGQEDQAEGAGEPGEGGDAQENAGGEGEADGPTHDKSLADSQDGSALQPTPRQLEGAEDVIMDGSMVPDASLLSSTQEVAPKLELLAALDGAEVAKTVK